jgi:hypothetical protein
MAGGAKPDPSAPSSPLEPNSREHGVWGYRSDAAVGGFGEDYGAQVARGSEPGVTDAAATDDDALSLTLRKALAQAHIDAADLRLEVSGGRVTLHGSVRRELERSELVARARAVPGVAAVISRLEVLSGAAGAS